MPLYPATYAADNAYSHTSGAGTFTIKSGQGVLEQLVINTCSNNAKITLYDSLVGSGTVLGVLTVLGANFIPTSVTYGIRFNIGLTIVTTTATTDLTVAFR